jgi:uncharacterized protein (TIGR02646 family)
MIQIDTPVKLNRFRKRYIRWIILEFNKEPRNVELWDYMNGVMEFKNLKDGFRLQLLIAQQFKCVFCQASLLQEKLEIDHFAPKAHYPFFTFTRTNLFLVCGLCNSPTKKGDYRTIAPPTSKKYFDNHFKLLHPYYHEIDKEIKYIDPDNLVFDLNACSPLAYFTIKKFGLDTARMLAVRHDAGKALSERKLKDKNLLELVRDVITFDNRIRKARKGILPLFMYK